MPKAPSLANQIAAMPEQRKGPLWAGPCAEGPTGGITQSMIARWLGCRDRFRVKYVVGLSPPERWNKSIGYGNLWHAAEEAHAAGKDPAQAILNYAKGEFVKHPMDREEIEKWFSVCCVQFPEYVKYWRDHPDVKNRTPLMQEHMFDVPYKLPSGRVVRLRGKFDSVDLIDGGVYLQENKTKGDIDQLEVQRQLKFDLQTMMYLIALCKLQDDANMLTTVGSRNWHNRGIIQGVRYNVVRRPLSGGKGSIRPHAAKDTKTKHTPAETLSDFYERLRRDYIVAEPEYWFFRVRSEVSARDIKIFKDTCLDPVLEQMCWWYDEAIGTRMQMRSYQTGDGRDDKIYPYNPPPMNYRMPFGVYNPLTEGGSTEYDAFFETGSSAGMVETKLFPELQDANASLSNL